MLDSGSMRLAHCRCFTGVIYGQYESAPFAARLIGVGFQPMRAAQSKAGLSAHASLPLSPVFFSGRRGLGGGGACSAIRLAASSKSLVLLDANSPRCRS